MALDRQLCFALHPASRAGGHKRSPPTQVGTLGSVANDVGYIGGEH